MVLLDQLFIFGFLGEAFSPQSNSVLLGLNIIFLTFIIALWLRVTFFRLKLKNPELKFTIEEAVTRPSDFNLAELLSFEVARAVYKSIKFAKSKKLPEINSTILFYFLVVAKAEFDFVFARLLLNLEEIKKTLKSHLKTLKGEKFNEVYSQDFQQTILEALKIAQKNGHQRIEIVGYR